MGGSADNGDTTNETDNSTVSSNGDNAHSVKAGGDVNMLDGGLIKDGLKTFLSMFTLNTDNQKEQTGLFYKSTQDNARSVLDTSNKAMDIAERLSNTSNQNGSLESSKLLVKITGGVIALLTILLIFKKK